MSKSTRVYMCSACLIKHPAPTGRNCPFSSKKIERQLSEPEEVFNSPTIVRVDRLVSGLQLDEMPNGDGDDGKPGEGGASSNKALLDIVRIQQEQMKALHLSIEKMNSNMSELSKKVSKNKKSSKALRPQGVSDLSDTSSDTDSDDMDRRPSLASPAIGVPEFRSDSKRHKFSLKAYLPKTVTKPVTFAVLISALLALVMAVSTAGFLITGMLDHLRFLSDKASTKSHTTESLIAYDEEVRRLAEHEGLSAFTYGHQSFINKHLGADSLAVQTGKKAKSTKGAYNSPPSPSNVYESLRENKICWYWNYRTCTNSFCKKEHICYLCYGQNHKQGGCKNTLRQENPKSQ